MTAILTRDDLSAIKRSIPWVVRMFLAAGIVCIIGFVYSAVQSVRATYWPQTDAEIVSAEIVEFART